jgi:hypothetical protein
MTRAELVARLRQQAADAERLGATAPVATVLRAVVEDVEQVTGLAPHAGPDRLLTLAEAADRLAVPVRWFSEGGRDAPFLRRLSRRQVRVSEQALTRWLAKRAGEAP